MNDELLQSLLDEGFKAMDTTPKDVDRSTRRVIERKEKVRQRSRWWPFPVFYRGIRTPTATHTTEYRPSPTQATDGHTPTVLGSTQSMLSPAKAITAGALVFAIGGAFLIAQPFEQESSVPGAESFQPPPAPVPFTSTYRWSGQSTNGATEEYDDGVTVATGVGWLFNSIESSDPRFAGPLVNTYTETSFPEGDSIGVGGYRIETDEGAWQQVPAANMSLAKDAAAWNAGLLPPENNIQFWTLTGEGAYEGLTAVVQETWWPDGNEGEVRFDGNIFEGDLWPAPEPWVP